MAKIWHVKQDRIWLVLRKWRRESPKEGREEAKANAGNRDGAAKEKKTGKGNSTPTKKQRLTKARARVPFTRIQPGEGKKDQKRDESDPEVPAEAGVATKESKTIPIGG